MFALTPTMLGAALFRRMAGLPLPVSRACSSLLWSAAYLLDVKQLRSTIRPCIQQATACSSLTSHVIGRGAAVAMGRYVADFAFFLHRPVAAIQRRARRHTALHDTEELVEIWRRGKGAILVTSNFSCFYYALAATPIAPLHDAEILIVQPYLSLESDAAKRFKDKMSDVVGRELKVIESGTLRAGMEMAAALKRGALVACMVDFYPPNNASLAITEFLNHPSCQPTGIATIAARTGAPVVPCFTFYEDGRYLTRFSPALYPPADHRDSDGVLALCGRIDATLTDTILSRPAEWASWFSVPQKWNSARALLAQIEEQTDAHV